MLFHLPNNRCSCNSYDFFYCNLGNTFPIPEPIKKCFELELIKTLNGEEQFWLNQLRNPGYESQACFKTNPQLAIRHVKHNSILDHSKPAPFFSQLYNFLYFIMVLCIFCSTPSYLLT